MAKLTLTDLTAGFDLTAYNANNTLIEAAIENTLSRDGTTPNNMDADLDMNSYDVNNISDLHATRIFLNGVQVSGIFASEVGELADVTLTSLGDNEILQYNLGTLTWENQTLAEAGISEVGHTHATSDIVSGTFANARIAESNVTQHEAALTILESQITDGSLLARVAGNETISGTWQFTGTTRVGSDGAGNSVLDFYDDNSDTWRSIRWNDTNNVFEFEDNNGNFNEFGSGSGTGFLLIGA